MLHHSWDYCDGDQVWTRGSRAGNHHCHVGTPSWCHVRVLLTLITDKLVIDQMLCGDNTIDNIDMAHSSNLHSASNIMHFSSWHVVAIHAETKLL